jgi:hypothetical protein
VGIRKRRGRVSRSPSPNAMKIIIQPAAGVELEWRIIVMSEIPKAPPTDLNIPRRPVMGATFSGMSSRKT